MLDKNKTSASEKHVITGKVSKAHGIKGEIYIYLFAKEASWLDQLTEVKLIIEESDVVVYRSYSLKRKKEYKDGLILKINGIDSRNQSESLVGALFEVPETFFQSKAGEEIYLREILNFTVMLKGSPKIAGNETDKGTVNENNEGAYKEIGEIIGFSSNTAQDLAVIKTELGEFEVPLVDQFIIKIDHQEKKFFMELPEGLLGEA